jgi:hypothetical protein
MHVSLCVCHILYAAVRIILIIHPFIFWFSILCIVAVLSSLVGGYFFVVTMSLSFSPHTCTHRHTCRCFAILYIYIYTIIHNYTFTYILKKYTYSWCDWKNQQKKNSVSNFKTKPTKPNNSEENVRRRKNKCCSENWYYTTKILKPTQ